MAYGIVFNAKAAVYLDSLPFEVAEQIEDALDALETNPAQCESVQFKTAFLLTVAGHDIAWTYSKRADELIVASIRPIG